jgi:mono/diheme cytochrome c family protein
MQKATLAVAVAVLAAAATIATASDHHDRRRDHHEGGEHAWRGRSAPPAPAFADAEGRALYVKECGACHLAFPPGLLPAESHRRIMAGLDRHFGQNAELEPAVRDGLERYLVANAAEAGTTRKSAKVLGSLGGAAPLRITEVPWFQRKHRKIDPAVAARPSIRSRANCAACHAGAADWDFDEDRVRIPAS